MTFAAWSAASGWAIKGLLLVAAVGVGVLVKRLCGHLRRNLVLRRQLSSPPQSFLLGAMVDSRWDAQRHRLVESWVNVFGSAFRIRLAWVNVAVVTDPEVVREVLHRHDLDKSVGVYSPVSQMMSHEGHMDLVSCLTDANWRLFRKALAHAFNPANTRNGFRHTAKASAELVGLIRAGGPAKVWDMNQACLCETMDVIGQFGFGHDFKAVKRLGEGVPTELMEIMELSGVEVERRLNDPTRAYLWRFTSSGRQGARCFRRFQDIMRELLDDIKGRLGREPPESDGSLAAHLLRLRDPDTGAPISDPRLLPHIGTFFSAGHDTTGQTMTWTLFYISQYPDVEKKIIAELQDAGVSVGKDASEPSARHLAFEDLSNLPYLAGVIKESMRLYPVAATATLRVNEKDDITLGNGLLIPAGTGIWVPQCGLHSSKKNWGDDVEEFRPERWLEADADNHVVGPASEQAASEQKSGGDGNTKRSYEMGITRDSTTAEADAKFKRFMPFSDGRRDCIGQALAKMNVNAGIAILLANFHFELESKMGGKEGVRAAELMAISLRPANGMMMTALPRQ